MNESASCPRSAFLRLSVSRTYDTSAMHCSVLHARGQDGRPGQRRDRAERGADCSACGPPGGRGPQALRWCVRCADPPRTGRRAWTTCWRGVTTSGGSAPHFPQWLEEVYTPERHAPGCYWIQPPSMRFLWIAANEFPLLDELIPFLLARSGQALDECCRWVAPRRPLDWVLNMLDTYRCRCRRKRSSSGGSAQSRIP
jgi:hypothetical protein